MADWQFPAFRTAQPVAAPPPPAPGWDDDADLLIGFGGPCEQCGEFVEAEASPEFLERYGVLCDGHRCANA